MGQRRDGHAVDAQASQGDLRQKLRAELDTVDWRALRAQAARDNVILVTPALDLVEVAWCVASDRSVEVARWIGAGQLRKPTGEELSTWEQQLAKPFRALIVAPYVLVQEACSE